MLQLKDGWLRVGGLAAFKGSETVKEMSKRSHCIEYKSSEWDRSEKETKSRH